MTTFLCQSLDPTVLSIAVNLAYRQDIVINLSRSGQARWPQTRSNLDPNSCLVTYYGVIELLRFVDDTAATFIPPIPRGLTITLHSRADMNARESKAGLINAKGRVCSCRV